MALNITKARDIKSHGVKILIYAPSGTGKTTLAGTLGDKVLVLNAENGVAVLRESNCDIIDVKTREEAFTIGGALSEGGELFGKYDTIVLDSISEIAESIAAQLSLDPYYGDPANAFKYWGEVKTRTIGFLKAFRDLPNMNVVFIALESEIEINSLQVKYPMAVGKGSMKAMPSIFDEVLKLESDHDGKRTFRTSTTSDFVAKSRYGVEDGTDIMDLSELYDGHLYRLPSA